MSGNMRLSVHVHVLDTVQQISKHWIVSSKVDNLNGLKCTIMWPINMSDTVQQIKQSMYWMVPLTFDLIHFVGYCPANIHVLEYLAN